MVFLGLPRGNSAGGFRRRKSLCSWIGSHSSLFLSPHPRHHPSLIPFSVKVIMTSHTRLLWLFLTLLPSLALSLHARSTSSGPRVHLTTGTIEGLYNGTMEVFLGMHQSQWERSRTYTPAGIPYAEPPLGSLRFRAPQSAPPHEGVLAAKTWADGCHQIVRRDHVLFHLLLTCFTIGPGLCLP